MAFDINPIRKRYNWNYSNHEKEDYTTVLKGTVINIQETQAAKFSTDRSVPPQPDFWQNRDGSLSPKMNIRVVLATPTGEIKTFTFQPAGKEAKAGRKPSVHMDLWRLSQGSMMNLVGQTLQFTTQDGDYGRGNPRPFWVELVPNEVYQATDTVPAEFMAERVLMDTAASGGAVQQPQYAQPMQQQYMPQQPMQQQYAQYQQPMQQQYQAAPPAQPYQQYQQPMQQQQYQAPMQPMQQQYAPQQQYMPQQPMQQYAPQQQQPYDDIPF